MLLPLRGCGGCTAVAVHIVCRSSYTSYYDRGTRCWRPPYRERFG